MPTMREVGTFKNTARVLARYARMVAKDLDTATGNEDAGKAFMQGVKDSVESMGRAAKLMTVDQIKAERDALYNGRNKYPTMIEQSAYVAGATFAIRATAETIEMIEATWKAADN